MEARIMPEVIIHGFETSNNIKVRIALGFKEIPYTFKTIDPGDREEILRLSGQRLTPILVHGDRVLFDSAAILRYLEANFHGRPPLFGTSLIEQWAIEDLELFARHTLAAPMMKLVHHRVSGGVIDDPMQVRCAAAFMEAAGALKKKLAGRRWLVGESMSAADVTAAAVMYRIRQAKLFEPPPGMEHVQEWEDRVIAFDRHLQRPGK
jgi:glutathione S-transferase